MGISRKNYSNVIENFGPAVWIPQKILNLPMEGWFLIDVTPCPPREQIGMVIADIENDENINVEYGKLFHSSKCSAVNHEISAVLKKAVAKIKEETFLVAVYPGHDSILNGQPLAVSLNPVINYELYPDHPHINMGGNYPTVLPGSQLRSGSVKLPPTICYGYNKQEYSLTDDEKLLKVFDQVSMWLFRHQVWYVVREITGKGRWIGRGAAPLGPEAYPNYLNPNGVCRCGSHKQYYKCHMPEDYAIMAKCSLQEAEHRVKDGIVYFGKIWKSTVQRNERILLYALNTGLRNGKV